MCLSRLYFLAELRSLVVTNWRPRYERAAGNVYYVTGMRSRDRNSVIMNPPEGAVSLRTHYYIICCPNRNVNKGILSGGDFVMDSLHLHNLL